MTLDLNDPSVKQEVEKLISSAVDKATEGLKNKNSELLGKLAGGKATAEELEQAQAALKKIEDDKLASEQNWTELESRLRAEQAALKEDLEGRNRSLEDTLKERDLLAALAKENVAPVYLEAAKAMFKDKVIIEDGNTVVDGKPLSEFVNEWAQSETGKAFVAAPKNSGGDAPGSSGAKPKSMKFDEMTDMEKVNLKNNDPAAYDKSLAEFRSRQ